MGRYEAMTFVAFSLEPLNAHLFSTNIFFLTQTAIYTPFRLNRQYATLVNHEPWASPENVTGLWC